MEKTAQPPLSCSLLVSSFSFEAFCFPLVPLWHFFFFFFSEAGLNRNKFISSLFLCCYCCGHKPFLSTAVSAVIETYYLCFLLSSQVASYFQGCTWITGIISCWHLVIFFVFFCFFFLVLFCFVFFENLSALFTISIVFPLRADLSWMANIETDPVGDETQGHTMGMWGGGELGWRGLWRAAVWRSRWGRVFLGNKMEGLERGRKYSTGTIKGEGGPL